MDARPAPGAPPPGGPGERPSCPAAAARLTGAEVARTVSLVVATYGGALLAVHAQATSATAGPESSEPANYWGTLPSAWDHPEPNYVVSGVIAEFWSSLTTIPVAGALLMHLGIKYRYSGKVLRIYALTLAMYSLAFSAHLTLEKHVFSTTVVSVMSNALLTFAEFSCVVHRLLRSVFVRGAIVVAAEAALVAVVATLPYALEANGGVWTLFVVQSPGVFLATALATILARRAALADNLALRDAVRLASTAGALLSTAMVLSFVECSIGFEHGFFPGWWGFPWLHICIHLLEQVGIYIFGVGIAALDAALADPAQEGAEVGYLGGWLAYFYCPHPAKLAVERPARGGAELHAPLVDGGDGRLAQGKQEEQGAPSTCSTEAGELPGLAAPDPPRRRVSRTQTPPPRAQRATTR